jgi:chromosome segregation ATPase
LRRTDIDDAEGGSLLEDLNQLYVDAVKSHLMARKLNTTPEEHLMTLLDYQDQLTTLGADMRKWKETIERLLEDPVDKIEQIQAECDQLASDINDLEKPDPELEALEAKRLETLEIEAANTIKKSEVTWRGLLLEYKQKEIEALECDLDWRQQVKRELEATEEVVRCARSSAGESQREARHRKAELEKRRFAIDQRKKAFEADVAKAQCLLDREKTRVAATENKIRFLTNSILSYERVRTQFAMADSRRQVLLANIEETQAQIARTQNRLRKQTLVIEDLANRKREVARKNEEAMTAMASLDERKARIAERWAAVVKGEEDLKRDMAVFQELKKKSRALRYEERKAEDNLKLALVDGSKPNGPEDVAP